MKTIRIDERTICTMALIAMDVYGISIDVNESDSIRAGMKEFFDRMQSDAIPDSEPIAQMKAIAADMARLHSRMVQESNPQPRRIAA